MSVTIQFQMHIVSRKTPRLRAPLRSPSLAPRSTKAQAVSTLWTCGVLSQKAALRDTQIQPDFLVFRGLQAVSQSGLIRRHLSLQQNAVSVKQNCRHL